MMAHRGGRGAGLANRGRLGRSCQQQVIGVISPLPGLVGGVLGADGVAGPRCEALAWWPSAGAQDNGNRIGDDMAMRRLPVLLAAAAATLAVAAPAHADPNTIDQQFLDALNKAGITYQSPEQAVNAARQVCALMGKGQSGAVVVEQLTQVNPGFAADGAQKFTAIAASAYCPQYIRGGGTGDDAPGPH
jgi:hypothetical protein